MKLSQAKEYLPFVQAAADGKIVQMRSYDGTWIDLAEDDALLIFFQPPESYRIKPTPKLRPWKPEEVPVGALLKQLSDGCEFPPAVILGVVENCGNSQLPAAILSSGSLSACGRNSHFYLSDLLTYHGGKDDKIIHSTDNGKTWLPCGVEE